MVMRLSGRQIREAAWMLNQSVEYKGHDILVYHQEGMGGGTPSTKYKANIYAPGSEPPDREPIAATEGVYRTAQEVIEAAKSLID